MMDTLKMDIDALLGERWFPKETSFEEDITEYWGEWGVCSEVETLRAVLMRRPGKEVESFDPKAVRFSDEPIDVELMRRQHDNVAKVYTDFGAKVYYVEHQLEDRPNAVFCRDLMFMTPEGAIITAPAWQLVAARNAMLPKLLLKSEFQSSKQLPVMVCLREQMLCGSIDIPVLFQRGHAAIVAAMSRLKLSLSVWALLFIICSSRIATSTLMVL